MSSWLDYGSRIVVAIGGGRLFLSCDILADVTGGFKTPIHD